jgi:aspartate aminotransferase
MEMKISKKIGAIAPSATLAIDAKAKELKAQGIDVAGFGAGEPDFDTPQNIKEAAIRAIEAGCTKYTPASGTLELKKAVCAKFFRDNGLTYTPDQIVISNGAKHSLVNIFMAICDPGDEVIIPSPYWVSYPEMVKIADGVPVALETTEATHFKFTAEELEHAIGPKTVALILNSPSNPTGMAYTRAELEQIANVAVKHGIYVISDEIYEHLLYEGEHISIASLGEEIKAQTIIVNGVSKTYAMTGWRIGYTASDAKLAKAMGNLQSHASSNPNSIAQAAAVEALNGPQDSVVSMKAEFAKRRDYMVSRINSMDGVSCIAPHGAFYVFMSIEKLVGKTLHGKEITGANAFAQVLLEEAKVAVVPSEGFGIQNYVRWSYATSMETIQKGLDRLEAFLR